MRPLHQGILQRIPVPILGLFGKLDSLVPLGNITAMSKANPNFQTVVFEECVHLQAKKKKKSEYFDAIFKFLDVCPSRELNRKNIPKAKL